MCPKNQSLQVLDDNSCICYPSGSTCELCASTTPLVSSFHCNQWDVLQLDASWTLSAGNDYCQAARSVNDSSSWAWFKFHKGISITASTLSISLGYWPSSGSSSGCSSNFVSVATLPIGSVVGLYSIPDIIFAIPYGGMGGFFIYCANTFDVCRALMDVHVCQL